MDPENDKIDKYFIISDLIDQLNDAKLYNKKLKHIICTF